jgi:hypothetical protein
MMDSILYSVSIRASLDLIKNKLTNNINSKNFSMIFNETLREIASEYEIVISDLEEFLKSDEVIEQLELHLEDMNLDFKYLGKILLDEYIILNENFSSEKLLRDFFESLGANLLKYPELKEHLIIRYIKALRQDHAKLIENTSLIIENQESLNKILSQITVFGKTLKRDDYINNVEFFKEISKILNEDPLYTHKLNITGDQVIYSIISKSDEAQRLEPIHGSFTIILGQRDGNTFTLDEMLEESEKTGKPIIIDASSIKGISIYKGNKSLLPDFQKIHHIEIRSIPFELPVTIFVPGSGIQYDIALRAEERSSTLLVLTNYFSEFPIKFKFQFDLEKGNELKSTGRFNITCEIQNMDVIQAYQFHKFIGDAIENGILAMKDSRSGKTIFTAYINDIDKKVKPFENQFGLLRKLSFMQEVTGIKIPLPLRMTAEDIVSIENAFNFYRYKKIIMSFKNYCLNFSLDSEHVKELLEKVDEDGILYEFTAYHKRKLIQVCSVELPLGPIVEQYPAMRIEQPIQELRKELDNGCKETFNIKLLPINDDPLIITPTKLI